jgi:hypothetical protein
MKRNRKARTRLVGMSFEGPKNVRCLPDQGTG